MQTINIGATPNDGTGDTPRAAFTKVNANFNECVTGAAVPGAIAGQPINPSSTGATTPGTGAFTSVSGPGGMSIACGSGQIVLGDPYGTPQTVVQNTLQVYQITAASRLTILSSTVIQWANDEYFSSPDLGLSRSAAGTLEVNNGTPVASGGAYGDVKLANLTARVIAGGSLDNGNITLMPKTSNGGNVLVKDEAGILRSFIDGTSGSYYSTGALTLGAGGTNQNVVLSPTGTGVVSVPNLTASGTGSFDFLTSVNNTVVGHDLGVNGTTYAHGPILGDVPGRPTGEYTLAGLPSAAAWTGKTTSVSNPASGKSYAVRSDGTNWRYVADQSIAA